MIFRSTRIEGLYEVVLERRVDDRGTFARTFCRDEFAAHGLPTSFVQASASVTRQTGTLRGMHFQCAGHAEGKLVRCVRGVVHDVVADIRPNSPSFGQWQAFHLAAEEDVSLYIPPGCAHGFQTLRDDTEVLYQMTVEYAPGYASGFRYDDPGFAITWPLPIALISQQDLAWPPFSPASQG